MGHGETQRQCLGLRKEVIQGVLYKGRPCPSAILSSRLPLKVAGFLLHLHLHDVLPFRRLSAIEPVGHGEKPLTVSQLKASSFQIDSLSHYNSHLSLQQNVTDTVTKQYGSIKTDPLLRQAVYLERCTPAVQ